MGKRSTPAPSKSSAALQLSWPNTLHAPYLPLELQILLDDQIILIPNFFTARDCEAWARFIDSLTLEPSPAAKRGEARRTNSRLSSNDQAFAEQLWVQTGLRNLLLDSGLDAFRDAKGLNQNIRLYRYEPKQAFERHYDDSVRDAAGRTSRWTLLLYLSGEEDGIVGGETAFYPDNAQPIVARLQRGTMLLHKHGSDCLLHEGRAVISGPAKLVLRTDVVF